MAALFTVPGFGQTERTFYFAQPATQADMTAMVTTIRTMVDLQDISIDPERRALVTHGPLDKLVAAAWLFEQLDRTGYGAPAHYKMPDEKGEVMAIVPVSPAATMADITAVTTAIRTVADVQRLFPYEVRKAIVGRASPEKIAQAEWVVHEVLPVDGQTPAGDSQPYPVPPDWPGRDDRPAEIRVFRMDPKATNAQLTATVTAIRTVADIQRLFPFQSGNALIMKASSEQVAAAGWLVHELAKLADAGAVHQTTMPGLIDGVVRLFYVGPQMDAVRLAAQIRSTVDIQRLYPFGDPPAVVLRGRPDQMLTVEALVAKFVADSH
jgi:hypothetical protein